MPDRTLKHPKTASPPGAALEERSSSEAPPDAGGARARRLRLGVFLSALARINLRQTHDLRGRLGNLVLQLGLLQEVCRQGSNPENRAREERYLAALEAEAGRLQAAIETLLEQTRLAGDPGEVDLRRLLEQLRNLLAPVAASRRVGWETIVPEGPARVADPVATRQGLTCLMIHALENVPIGGKLTVRLQTSAGLVALSIEGSAPPRVIAAPENDGEDSSLEAITEFDLDVARSMLSSEGAQVRTLETPGVRRIEIEWPRRTGSTS